MEVKVQTLSGKEYDFTDVKSDGTAFDDTKFIVFWTENGKKISKYFPLRNIENIEMIGT